jgi:hypothetical protein
MKMCIFKIITIVTIIMQTFPALEFETCKYPKFPPERLLVSLQVSLVSRFATIPPPEKLVTFRHFLQNR